MEVLHVYCFKSVGSYRHKLSRIESLVVLYWGINCMFGQILLLNRINLKRTRIWVILNLIGIPRWHKVDNNIAQ